MDATLILCTSIPLMQFLFPLLAVLQNIANRKWKGCHEGSSTDRTRMAITS